MAVEILVSIGVAVVIIFILYVFYALVTSEDNGDINGGKKYES